MRVWPACGGPDILCGRDYGGSVQGGVIVLEPRQRLPEGQAVDVIPLQPPPPAADEDDLPGAGLWQDRTDLGDTAEAALELRRATDQRSR